MGFIGVQPSSVPLTSSDITDGIVSNAKLGADSVNSSKIADDSISEEHIDITAITGHSAITSLADTDKFLVSDASDSNNLKYVEKQYLGGSGTLVPLAQIESSSDASVIALDNFMDATTYTAYKVFFACKSGGNGNVLQARFRQSGGAHNTTDYDFANISRYHNATDNESGNGENHADIYDDGSTNTAFFEFTIFPNGGIGNQGLSSCIWQSSDRKYNGNSRRPRIVVGAFQFVNSNVPDGFQIENTTANFEDYEMHAYGIKKS
jgi:hypothetical protein